MIEIYAIGIPAILACIAGAYTIGLGIGKKNGNGKISRRDCEVNRQILEIRLTRKLNRIMDHFGIKEDV